MREFNFDLRTFNKKYALTFTVIQYVLIWGFAIMVAAVILGTIGTFHITIPDVLLPVALGYFLVSLVGFPVVTTIKVGYKRSLLWSRLLIDEDGLITYDKLAEKMWSIMGGVEERHIFTIKKIDKSKMTTRRLIIVGDIHLKIINNNRLLEEKDLTTIKIPRAYANMERIIDYE